MRVAVRVEDICPTDDVVPRIPLAVRPPDLDGVPGVPPSVRRNWVEARTHQYETDVRASEITGSFDALTEPVGMHRFTMAAGVGSALAQSVVFAACAAVMVILGVRYAVESHTRATASRPVALAVAPRIPEGHVATTQGVLGLLGALDERALPGAPASVALALRRGDLGAALGDLRLVADRLRDEPSLHAVEGLRHMIDGNLRRARASFDEALHLDASHLPALLGKADLAWASGDANGAVELYHVIVRATEGSERCPAYVRVRALR